MIGQRMGSVLLYSFKRMAFYIDGFNVRTNFLMFIIFSLLLDGQKQTRLRLRWVVFVCFFVSV